MKGRINHRGTEAQRKARLSFSVPLCLCGEYQFLHAEVKP